ncbi:Hypothetical predicted protein [Olea europaea subsp. europaea]|uniref:Uncharacterized protein n=1 Tax=Olea europaea subsp. europaea TaxID=158383 RepID=A0A8S0TR82_OLEEU|nr:Hypothetical predicted protein [Olea europaea subsp. europaea]
MFPLGVDSWRRSGGGRGAPLRWRQNELTSLANQHGRACATRADRHLELAFQMRARRPPPTADHFRLRFQARPPGPRRVSSYTHARRPGPGSTRRGPLAVLGPTLGARKQSRPTCKLALRARGACITFRTSGRTPFGGSEARSEPNSCRLNRGGDASSGLSSIRKIPAATELNKSGFLAVGSWQSARVGPRVELGRPGRSLVGRASRPRARWHDSQSSITAARLGKGGGAGRTAHAQLARPPAPGPRLAARSHCFRPRSARPGPRAD